MKLTQEIHRALHRQPIRIVAPGTRVHAAVAIIMHEREEGVHVLLLERAVNENDFWSGNISFPGGRVESFDTTARQAAERETREEVGLDLTGARFLGRLSDYPPGGLPIVISSFVYAVAGNPVLNPNPQEVAAAFWFPLAELADPRRCTTVEFHFRQRTRRFPALRLNCDTKQPLWGITYRLLHKVGKLSSPDTH